MDGKKRQAFKGRENERKPPRENWRARDNEESTSSSSNYDKRSSQNKRRDKNQPKIDGFLTKGKEEREPQQKINEEDKNPPKSYDNIRKGKEEREPQQKINEEDKNPPKSYDNIRKGKEETEPQQKINEEDKCPTKFYDNVGKEEREHQQKKKNEEDADILTMKEGNLFDAPEDYSLAHCVAADFKMGKGIAVEFRKQFQDVDKLLNQRVKVGGVGILENKGRFIYYLVTKKYSFEKPYLEDLEKSLSQMKKHCLKKNVTKIAIPLIGCGLDRLYWNDVSSAIQRIFRNTGVKFTVYSLGQEEEEEDEEDEARKKEIALKKTKAFKIKTRDEIHLKNIEIGSVILLFGSENRKMDDILETYNKKYHFLDKYFNSKENLIYFEKFSQYIYIIICKKNNGLIDYELLNKGFRDIVYKLNKDKSLTKDVPIYFGFQYFEEPDDDIVDEKIVNLLGSACGRLKNYVECHICKGLSNE